VVVMLFLIAFISAVVIALVLWKAMNAQRDDAAPVPRRPPSGPARSGVSGPDDDPDFLRQLDEKVRRRDDPPTA
jgi:hypothetical protein